MLDYAKLRESLKALITENTSQEEAEKIGEIAKFIDKAEEDTNALLDKNEELRQKYINAVKNSAFGESPKEEQKEDTPKTFEECIQAELDKRRN